MTEKKIHKLDPAKYTSNNEKGLILEVDPEYPNELHDIHNDYPSLLKKKSDKNMLTNYCEKIRSKYNLATGQLEKLNPTLRKKEKHVYIIEISNYFLI